MDAGTRTDAAEPVRWGRVVALLVVFWFILELVARGFVFVWVGRAFDSFSKYRFSPYGLVRNNPRLTLPGFEHNVNGFRNRNNFVREKAPGTLRVMILGGSTAYSGLASEMIAEAERPDTDSVINVYLERAIRSDPDFAGVTVEVINAAVPFNRAFELSNAYISEYAQWSPDVVIVMGSGNNFNGPPPYEWEISERKWGTEGKHPWAGDFERIANEKSPLTFVEHGTLLMEDRLASAALLRKVGSKVADNAVRMRDRWVARTRPAPPVARLASFDEFDRYIDIVLGIADGMVSVARHNDQEMVFFWEYYLRHLGPSRAMGPQERALYESLKRPTDDRDASYNFHARDRFADFCKGKGVRFLDPLEVLKTDPTPVFIDYLHYTPDGNRVMGEFMYRELRDVLRERGKKARDGAGAGGAGAAAGGSAAAVAPPSGAL